MATNAVVVLKGDGVSGTIRFSQKVGTFVKIFVVCGTEHEIPFFVVFRRLGALCQSRVKLPV